METNYSKASRLAYEIESYTSLENDSPSEACELLSQLAGYPDYVSDKFYEALILELEDKLKYYQDNCEIIEEDIEIKQIHKTKRLKWIDEAD